jgi:hypothetical protein
MPTSIELFEDRAQGCIEAAERADDPDVRKLLLKTAREWMQGAAALRASSSERSAAADIRGRRRSFRR